MGDHYLQQLRKIYEEEAGKVNQLREEIEEIHSQIADLESQSFSLHLENEELLNLQDRQIRLHKNMSERFMESLTVVNDGIEKIDGKIHDVLMDYTTQKEADREMVLRTFQTFRDIPKDYSEEVIKEKIIDIDEKIKQTIEDIKKEEAELIELKQNYVLDDTKDRDEAFETFITDLKKININLTLQLPKK